MTTNNQLPITTQRNTQLTDNSRYIKRERGRERERERDRKRDRENRQNLAVLIFSILHFSHFSPINMLRIQCYRWGMELNQDKGNYFCDYHLLVLKFNFNYELYNIVWMVKLEMHNMLIMLIRYICT